MDKEIIERIRACRLMSGIADVEKLLKCFEAREMVFRAGDEVVGYGDRASIVIITEGSAIAVSEDHLGNRNIINRLGVSGMFGAAYVYSGHEVTTRLVAETSGRAVMMGGYRLHGPCEGNCADHTRFLYNTVRAISHSCVGFLEKVEHLSRRTTRENVLSYLGSQAIKHGSASFDIPFSRQELADYLAVDRSALSAELGRMKAEGLIDFTRSKFRLLKAHE